jgi:hypothetical protein
MISGKFGESKRFEMLSGKQHLGNFRIPYNNKILALLQHFKDRQRGAFRPSARSSDVNGRAEREAEGCYCDGGCPSVKNSKKKN